MKRILIIFSVCLSSLGVLLSGALIAHGQIYKWVDAEGRVHYSATPTDEAQDVDEELPPASRFIAPARPPSPSSEAPSPDNEQPPQQASANPPDQSSTPTNDQSSSPGQQQPQKEEIGIGEYGPFGPDGPGGPAPNPE